MNLHDIAPRLARARDQRLTEIENEREFWRRVGLNIKAMSDFADATERLGRVGVPASQALRRVAEAWERPVPKGGK